MVSSHKDFVLFCFDKILLYMFIGYHHKARKAGRFLGSKDLESQGIKTYNEIFSVCYWNGNDR